MFCAVVPLCKRISRAAVSAAPILALRLAHHARRAWASHRTKVTVDPTYAAVAAIVLGALLGVVPLKDVLAAVLAAVLGVVTTKRPSRRARPWGDDWDVA